MCSSIALHVVANATSNRQRQRFSNAFDGNPIEDLLEETSDYCANGFFAGETTALSVKDQLFVNASTG